MRQVILSLRQTGRASDAPRLIPVLRDEDARLRREAELAIWHLWARSGNEQHDRRLQKALALLRAGQPQQALAQLDALLQSAPRFAEVWNRRASAHHLLGHHRLALSDCEAAVAIDDKHFGAWTGMGYSCMAIGDRPGAMAAFRHALALNPNLEGVRRSLAEDGLQGRQLPRLVV